ncbi:MAG TPA: hypothetical protein VK988_01610 [Acidimicrobiales bacterium]|nr:hypothetical protein [Acidimicrobiales bacterium]
MRRLVGPLLVLPTALLLVLAGMTLAFDWAGSSEDDPVRTTTTSTAGAPGSSPTTAAAPAPESPLDVLVRQIQGFVERERGLTFKTPVKVKILDEAAFRAKVTEIDDEDRKEIEESQAILRAMRLLDRDVDLLEAVQAFAGAGIAGLYDPETDELVVRGGEELSPSVRVTIAHELTHALEDQQFNLDRKDLGDEADYGFSALVEGSALRIEDAYLRSLPADERARARTEERVQAGKIPDNVPPVVQFAFGFPYVYGPEVVSALLRAGGNARLDAAFAKPPASTEQVIDPRRYLDDDQPRAVPVPRAEKDPFDDGEIGQLFLFLMLRSELSDSVARRASDGWGGDRYVAWRDGERTCVRMDFVMDTPSDNDELVRALREWAGKRRGAATASGSSLTTCG